MNDYFRWSQIANHLPGRTDNEVKNHWNSYLKKRVKNSQEASKSKELDNRNIACNQTIEPLASSSMDSSSSEGTTTTTITTQSSFIPKVIFADWFSMENVNGENSLINGDTSSMSCILDLEQNDTNFLDGFGESECVYGFEAQGQMGSQDGFFDLFYLGDLCGNFDISHNDA